MMWEEWKDISMSYDLPTHKMELVLTTAVPPLALSSVALAPFTPSRLPHSWSRAHWMLRLSFTAPRMSTFSSHLSLSA